MEADKTRKTLAEFILPPPLKKKAIINFYKGHKAGQTVHWVSIQEAEDKFKTEKSLSLNNFRKLIESINFKTDKIDLRKLSGWMEPGLLYIDYWTLDSFIWTSPPSEYKLLMGGKKEVTIKTPTMCFGLKGRSLNFHFTEDNPNPDSPLYVSGLGNISLDGSVCMPNVALKPVMVCQSIKEYLDQYRAIFLGSPFSHSSGATIFNDDTMKKYKLETKNDVTKFIIKQKEIKLEWLIKRRTIKDLK